MAMAVTDATMVERSGRPLPPASWKGQLLVGTALIISSIAHVALLGTVLFASPDANNAPPAKSITVDLVPEKDAPPAAKPETPNSEPPRPALERPAPETAAQEKSARQSNPAPQTSSTATKKPEAAAARAPSSQLPAPSPKAAQPESRPSQSQAMNEDAAATAVRLAHLLHLNEVDPSTAFEAPPSENRARLSRKEIAAFKAQLKKCWVPPAGGPAAGKVKVVLRIALSLKGELTKDPVLLAGSPSIHGPALFKSAREALAQCQPYTALPARKYKEWKELDLNFALSEILDVSSGAGFGTTRVTR
jgi:outer membrane biosynthesis protein TonB